MTNDVLPPQEDGEAPQNDAVPAAPHGAEPVSKTPSSGSEVPNPAKQPTPTGDPQHPGLTTRDGFYFFRDEYRLPEEPSVEDAETLYLKEVEKAFQNRWDLHPNLNPYRSLQQNIVHAYELDFRENEIKRIRDILPVDKPVFDYIDAFVDVVLLKNLQIFVGQKLDIYKHIVGITRISFLVFLAIFGVPLVGGIGFFAGWQWMIAGLIAAIPLAASATRIFTSIQTWPLIGKKDLKAIKLGYEEAVRDSAGLAASKLAAKGRDVETLMNSLKNRLDTMSRSDASRIEQAPKLVRILLWNPERMGLMENYYRAKMDQFNIKSARVSIAGEVFTKGTINNRRVFLSRLALFYALGLAVAWLWAHQIIGMAKLGDLINLPGCLTAMAAIAVAATAMSNAHLTDISYSFVPEEVARHSKALEKNGLHAALLGIGLGVLPMIAILAFPSLLVPVTLISFAAVLFTSVWFAIPAIFAYRIYEKYKREYSSNVLEAVQKKMDASQWTRYSDLRIDQRLAEVFTAIYAAWYKADSKGVYTPGG